MAANYHWISYDARDDGRRRRRKWPWILLLLLLLAAILVGGWLWYESSEGIDLAQPVAIQTALPALLTDDTMVVYVVDDSGSMEEKLLPLQQALQEVANKPTENSEIALLMFGETNRVLFDFAEPDAAPWADAIPSFTAGSGGTAMFLALQKAVDMLPARPVCTEKTRFIVFGETVCRQNRIVLMSDGMAGDVQFARETLTDLVQSGVPVDTVAFGVDADEEGLRLISDVTRGRFIRAR
jgi:uncharacterized protein YegL